MTREHIATHYPPRASAKNGHAYRQGYTPQADDADDEDAYDDQWPIPTPNSARRYAGMYTQGNTRYQLHPDQVQPIRRKSATPPQGARSTTGSIQAVKSKRSHLHWSLFLGLGMIIMLLAWSGAAAFLSWWQLHQDDSTYGRPRTSQYDVVVGHGDSPGNPTHFIAMNLHAKVLIIEVPGGDSSKAKIYQGPQLYAQNADLSPVTLSFRDVNGDGRLDMIVTVQAAQLIYLNVNNQFVLEETH